MISVCFQGKPFSITVIQVYAPTRNAEEAEVEPFYEDLQVLLELTPKKDVLFIIGDWNAKVGSQETPGVTGKFCLGIWNEAGQRLIEFCQENDQPRQHIQKQRHYFANKDPSSHARTHARMHACCHFSHVQFCATLWTAAHQAPLSTGFSRQEDWSGLPVPSP